LSFHVIQLNAAAQHSSIMNEAVRRQCVQNGHPRDAALLRSTLNNARFDICNGNFTTVCMLENIHNAVYCSDLNIKHVATSKNCAVDISHSPP